jgi:hypothetical protein
VRACLLCDQRSSKFEHVIHDDIGVVPMVSACACVLLGKICEGVVIGKGEKGRTKGAELGEKVRFYW